MPDNERCSMPRNTAANRTRIVAREWRESGCLDGYWKDMGWVRIRG